jgi:hypothetical protein
MLCEVNHQILQEIFGSKLIVCHLVQKKIQGAASAIRAFRGYIDGVDATTLDQISKLINEQDIAKVFIDGSNFGEVAKNIKQNFPHVEIFTYFHNVEVKFFIGAFRQQPGLRALAITIANFLAEGKAVRYSDKLISLSERDSHLLKRIYGRASTYISPIALTERSDTFEFKISTQEEKYALFVGGGFYANIAGIEWYIANVAPHIPIKTCVVGHGLEKLSNQITATSKVEVVGSVPNLEPWYRRAQVVVAPIFDGSGMKTKVAEALMYGKRVIGTPEAFSGYENVAAYAGKVCSNSQEFISTLCDIADEPFVESDPVLRTLYEKNYSYQSAFRRFQRIFDIPVVEQM